MNDSPAAKRVSISEGDQTFSVDWTDGHTSVFPLDGLRRACPCAGCRGGHDKMKQLPDPRVFRQPPRRRWEDVRVEAVGSYGLRITWDDGHSDGIYTWEYLRAICPCTACTGD